MEVFTIYVFATWIPKMSLSIRRLHDTGKSGMWYLISFLPLLGPVILFILWKKRFNQTNCIVTFLQFPEENDRLSLESIVLYDSDEFMKQRK